MKAKWIAVALFLCLADAASAQARRINVALQGWSETILLDTLTVWSEMNLSPGAAYTAASQVLSGLRIPATRVDSTHGLVMNQRFAVMHRMADAPMSRWLRCGAGIAGDNADTYRISVAYALFIDPLPGDRSRVGVALAAGANDIQGASKPTVLCATTGLFEKRIHELMRYRETK
jgi:hypothetical protein